MSPHERMRYGILKVVRRTVAAGLLAATVTLVQATPPQSADAPADLKPLLTPRQSELSVVVRRYSLDRQTLDANYAGSFDRLGVAADDAVRKAERPPLSRARLARLKRFDQNWASALAEVWTRRS